MATKRFAWPTSGKALNENIVCGDNYRLTVLTDCLIRLEQDDKGQFEDRATQMVFHRDFPVVDYTVTREDGILCIETAQLKLTYTEGAAFAADTLCIARKTAPLCVWHYGEKAPQLGGTYRTLDRSDGPINLDDGVCSRNGYAVIEDNGKVVLSEDGWFALRNEQAVDVYFFGHGHDYRGAVADLYRLTGAPPLLPDYALGNWWSRYWPYTQEEYSTLMTRFEREKIPFSVAVVDMDWHTGLPEDAIDPEENPRLMTGWTGYTWNKELFPDYKEFLRFLQEHNLKTALNLHPAQGVRCHEVQYEEMAKACGIDPATRKMVKLDILSPEYMEKYFDILHHPYEQDGVNFWWMDWQQGTDYWWVHDENHPESPLEVINPLWLLNHLHILDIRRNGKRPMFFSRYCGLGAHRYPVGFSGDTVVSWDALDFQPYFTATASNAGYSWWSHDIGGHMLGHKSDEMQVRWLQLGVFSPINRLHASINLFAGKEPWKLGAYARPIAEKWLRLRHQLFPYTYTMNYRNHTALAPMIQPMYYSHPECDAAYEHKNQYWFGSEMFVAPITSQNDPGCMMGAVDVWFPEGEWYDCFNGWKYRGERDLRVYRPLEQMPIFAKAGALIPMQKDTGDNRMGRKEDMLLYAFPGADNTFTLYEDEGDGSDYEQGRFATTEISMAWGDTATVTIAPSVGAVDLLPKKRNWTVYLRGFAKDVSVAVTVGGKAVKATAWYEDETHSMVVCLDGVAVKKGAVITVTGAALSHDNEDAEARMIEILDQAQTATAWKKRLWDGRAQASEEWSRDYTAEQAGIIGALREMERILPRSMRKEIDMNDLYTA